MSIQAIPNGYDALIPSKIVRDAAAAIQFYKDVFDATELMRMSLPGSSKIAHAEIKIRNHVLMLGDESPEMGMFGPPTDGKTMPSSSTFIYVPDVDATMARAAAKGAKVVMPAMDMFWGDRYAKFVDPFGHLWGVATHIKDTTPEECAKSMEDWAKQNKKG